MAQSISYLRANPVDIRVALNYAPLGIVHATTESIASDHMQVNTGSVTLNHSAEVEIVVGIPGPEHLIHHRISAQVGHSGEGGYTTLLFQCCDAETLMALRPYFSQH